MGPGSGGSNLARRLNEHGTVADRIVRHFVLPAFAEADAAELDRRFETGPLRSTLGRHGRQLALGGGVSRSDRRPARVLKGVAGSGRAKGLMVMSRYLRSDTLVPVLG